MEREDKPQTRQLLEILRSIEATGPEGFEGLVAVLLGELLQQPVDLARSGYQAGMDMATRGGTDAILGECKRYKRAKDLREREILGEIAQAIQNEPCLDLWVLAATVPVSAQLVRALQRESQARGLPILVLDVAELLATQFGPLLSLCIHFIELSEPFIRPQMERLRWEELLAWCAETRDRGEHARELAALKQQIEGMLVPVAADRIREHLVQLFDSPGPRNFVKQDIRPQDAVARPEVMKQLSDWLQEQPCDTIAAVVGEEGMGKTWAVARWARDLMESEGRAVIMKLSFQADMDSAPEALLSEHLRLVSRSSQYRCDDHWRRLVHRWRQSGQPRVIVVLDGLNELAPYGDTSLFLRKWLDEGLQRIAHLVITCRRTYWDERLSRTLSGMARLVPVGPYSDAELTEALARHSLTSEHIPHGLKETVRRPGYLSRAVKVRERLTGFSDVTPALLVYEEFSQKYEQNEIVAEELGVSDPRDFQRLLVRLAEAVSPTPGLGGLGIPDEGVQGILHDFVGDRWQQTRDAMCSMPILRRSEGGQYVLEERYLEHYLGCVVFRHVVTQEGEGEAAFAECFDGLMEPYSGFDLKTSMVGAAVFYALMEAETYPKTLRRLIMRWMFCQNFWGWETIAALLPRMREPFLDVVEDISGYDHRGQGMDRGVQYVLLRASDMAVDCPEDPLIHRLNRWLHMAAGKPHVEMPEEPMVIDGDKGRIGSIDYALRHDREYVHVPSLALAVLSHRPFLSCIDGLVAQAAVQRSAHSSGNRHALNWVVSFSYGQTLIPEIRRRLSDARSGVTKLRSDRLRALLSLANRIGDAELGSDIASLPDEWLSADGGSVSLVPTKAMVAGRCWPAEVAESCRELATSVSVDDDEWPHRDPEYWARHSFMKRQDEQTIDHVVGELSSGRGCVFDFDLQAIYESRHQGWLVQWAGTGAFPKRLMRGSRLPARIGGTLRPARYVLPALSSLCAGLGAEEIVNKLAVIDTDVWANGEIGQLRVGSDAMLSGVGEHLRGKAIRGGAGYTKDDTLWELGAPLLMRCAPLTAAEAIRSSMSHLLTDDHPRFACHRLSCGPCVVLDEEAGRILRQVFDRLVAKAGTEEGDDSEVAAAWALNALVMASPSQEAARATLLAAPPRILKWTSRDPVWDALGGQDMVADIGRRCRSAASGCDAAILLWCLKDCAYGVPDMARDIARSFASSEHQGVRESARAVLSMCGEKEDAIWMWDRLGELGLTDPNRRHFGLSLILRHAPELGRRRLNEWIRHVPLWVAGCVLDRWDDRSSAQEYARYIETRLREDQDLPDEALTRDIDWDCMRGDLAERQGDQANEMGCNFVSPDGLRFLLRHAPAWVMRWEACLSKEGKCMRFEHLSRQLVAALLPHSPEAAIRLLRDMERHDNMHCYRLVTAGVDTLKVGLCRSLSIPCVRKYVEHCLESVKSDAVIFQWARAMRIAKDDWEFANEWLESESPVSRAYAARLLGWSGTDCEQTLARVARTDPNDYVREAARWADEDWWREHWAKHWHGQIYRAASTEEAWAAQELFRLVADRRAIHWCDEAESAVPGKLKQWQRLFLAHAVFDDGNNFGKKYERELEKTLFGQSVQWLSGKVEPLI